MGLGAFVPEPGPAVTEGRLEYRPDPAQPPAMTIDFDNLEPVVDFIIATDLIVNGTEADNAINYRPSPVNPVARGLVSIDNFETK